MSGNLETDVFLSMLAGNLTAEKIGREVVVLRHFQSPVRGRLLRVHDGRAIVVAGHGAIPVEQVDRIET